MGPQVLQQLLRVGEAFPAVSRVTGDPAAHVREVRGGRKGSQLSMGVSCGRSWVMVP